MGQGHTLCPGPVKTKAQKNLSWIQSGEHPTSSSCTKPKVSTDKLKEAKCHPFWCRHRGGASAGEIT